MRAISRRQFLQSGSLIVAFTLLPELTFAQTARLPGSLGNNRMLDGWLKINADSTVMLFTGKVEIGQGIGTALVQICADELDVEIGRIGIVYGDTALTPNEGQTSGSLSVENSGTAVRFACAEAREILLNAAAPKLEAKLAELTVSDGTIMSPAGKTQTYWRLVGDIDLHREATAQAKPKSIGDYRWIGKNIPRRDIPKKFTGGAAYVQDVRLPGMVFGRVVRPPSPGATLISCDEAAVRAMPGFVVLVRDGNFLAVAAEREEQAIKMRAALKLNTQWKEVEALPPSGAELYEHMMRLPIGATTVADKSAPAALPVKTINASYTRPFLAHGSIGPSCAVARWDSKETGDTLQLFTHTQGVFPLRGELAKAFGIDQSRIRCTHVEGSGCYGQNGADDVAFDAARLAQAIPGRPVKLQWMRDDEFMWEPYGSAMAMKLEAALDAKGNIVRWSHELWSHSHSTRPGSGRGVNLRGALDLAKPPLKELPIEGLSAAGASDRNSVPLYDLPNVKVTKHFIPETPLRTSALRTLGGYANVFALESFMDELASAAKADPVEFRLRHLKDDRARAVIEAAADRSQWKHRQRDGSTGWGFAFAKYKNLACYCAIAIKVHVDRKTGQVRVLEAFAAADAGQIVNPDGLINQIEGGIIQSTSWTLKEAVHYDRTRVTTRSWSDYPILRFEEVPQVDVKIIDHPELPSLGVGEAAQGPTAAAIANAIAGATGRRLRNLPFKPETVKAAFG